MAYRRSVLAAVGGFDERFPRAYREDADLGLRVTAAGHRIVRGDRRMVHPVRPADRWVSVRLQKGNADDPLMRSLHGRGWRRAAGVPRGRRPWHVVTTAAAAAAAGATASGRRRTALGAAAVWTALTADFARRRIAPGPRTADEVATLALTSALVPPAATYHWLAGLLGLRRRRRSVVPPIGRVGCSISAPGSEIEHPTLRAAWPPMQALLVDRDGTIVRDVPYNGDPALVEPMPGAKAALDRVRAAGVPVAVISNQSGVGRGLLTDAQVDAVNARVSELLGPFAGWFVCRHVPGDGCACRKPEPELLLKAAAELGVEPAECVMVGDIGADVEAARRAGARGILVPTPVTLAAEVAAADETAADLAAAVALALAGRP
jgi:histidinol-phosphate phosphatase family protein